MRLALRFALATVVFTMIFTIAVFASEVGNSEGATGIAIRRLILVMKGGVYVKTFNEDKAVGKLAELIALECGIDPKKARQICIAAYLHDIGKQKICKEMLSRPGALTPEEYEIVKTHTILGEEMLSTFQGELGEMARNIARWHHEHWDGSGYWSRLLCELPYYIEIVAIADVYTALISPRPYKEAWTQEDALAYIQSQSDIRFSPVLVEMFVPLVRFDRRVAAIFEHFRS